MRSDAGGRARELEAVRRHATELEEQSAAMLNSLSWRITQPLRTGKAAAARSPRVKGLVPHAARRRLAHGGGEQAQTQPPVDGRPRSPRIVSRARHELRSRPLVSIVMPTWNTDPDLLRRTLASVRRQTYDSWQLCVCDDGSTNAATRATLRRAADDDPRVRVTFAESNRGIAAASNRALELAGGELIAFLDHDDELAPQALYEFVALYDEQPELDVVYSDEDKLDADGVHVEAFHKPDWSPEYLRGVMYVGHLLMVRRHLVEAVGGFDSTYDGVQDFDLVLRISEQTDRIAHLPLVLYHWRKTACEPRLIDRRQGGHRHPPGARRSGPSRSNRNTGRRDAAPDAPAPGGADAETRDRLAARLGRHPEQRTLPEHIDRCLGSIFGQTDYPSFDVLVVDNGTTDPAALDAIGRRPAKVVPLPGPFNFSRANNVGVAAAAGELVLLLNNDTEVVDPGLAAHPRLARPAAGGRRGRAAPHLPRRADPACRGGVRLPRHGRPRPARRPARSDGYAGSLACTHEVSAVTGACLLTLRRVCTEELGGLNERFATHYQDVDYCLRLRELGLRVLFTPRTTLIHHESASRGTRYDTLDRALLLDRWQSLIERGDPYYNP